MSSSCNYGVAQPAGGGRGQVEGSGGKSIAVSVSFLTAYMTALALAGHEQLQGLWGRWRNLLEGEGR